jgi:uncharacterized membrane protein
MRFIDSTALIFIVASIAAIYVSGVLWLNSPIFNVEMLCVATLAWIALIVGKVRAHSTSSFDGDRRLLVTLGICTILLAPLQDRYSDDARRYLWDGIVVASGGNPYASAPLKQPLVQYRTTLADGVMLPDDMPYASMRTIYPPGTLLVSGGIVAVLGTPTTQSFDVGWWMCIALLLGVALYAADHQSRNWLALAALSPVFLLHGLADVHSDALMACVALLAVLAHRRDRPYLSAVLLAVAITIKYVPVLLIPALLIGRSRRQQIIVLAVVCAVVIATYLPFLASLSSVVGSLPVFAAHWQANSLLYSMLTWLGSAWLTSEHIRLVLGLLALVLAAVIWRRHHKQPIAAAMMTYLALLICSPVVHAWYIILPVLLLPFAPLRSTITWATTMCVYGVFYATYKGDGVWFEHPVALAIEYIPVLFAFVRDVQCGPLLLRDQKRASSTTLA